MPFKTPALSTQVSARGDKYESIFYKKNMVQNSNPTFLRQRFCTPFPTYKKPFGP